MGVAVSYTTPILNFFERRMNFMSKMSKAVSGKHILGSDKVINFMGGTSYTLNPLQTLKLIAASSIFGEPQYYRASGFKKKETPIHYDKANLIPDILFKSVIDGRTATEVFTKAIDDSLSYDFQGTIELAIQLRKTYNMRLNPQVIMVRASIHPDRQKFTKKNPGKFDKINKLVMSRADEPMTQLAYYIYATGSKKDLPSILKRSIASKLSKLDAYAINKYKNAEIGMINAIRITHANSPLINELMKTGKIDTSEFDEPIETWEQLRSAGKSWKEILNSIQLGHMALLRNLRNIYQELDSTKSEDHELSSRILDSLKAGVLKGKQFPFRYYSAMDAIKESDIKFKTQVIDALEECMDISIENLPKLKGRTMCLSDNSGSAWGAVTSEYGSVTIAKIDNLSSVIAAKCSTDGGIVGKFGDKLIEYPISKRNGTLIQATQINEHGDSDVGGSTEGGIWEFFRKAIKNKEFFDNIFIFSDQQAGTGGLYGTPYQASIYGSKEWDASIPSYYNSRYIDVYKLIQMYRQRVNPKVNVFSVQTAGYTNAVIPMMAYRCAILTGWTGKEIQFAADYIKQWDEIEAEKKTPNPTQREKRNTSNPQSKSTTKKQTSYNKHDNIKYKTSSTKVNESRDFTRYKNKK